MSEIKVTENKKQDAKALKRFIPLLIVSAAVGFCMGIGSEFIVEGIAEIGELLNQGISELAPFLSLALNTILLVMSVLILLRCRKRFEAWDGENEEEMERIEWWLNIGIIATSVDTILSFFLFGAGLNLVFEDIEQGRGIFRMSLGTGAFIYSMVVMIVCQSRLVNLEKEINPEKQGSVYDVKFQKVWLESCDEFERQKVGQCAYKAYQVTNYTCMGLWLICSFGIIWWDFGTLPLLMVSVLWMVLTLTYSIESMRLSKRK